MLTIIAGSAAILAAYLYEVNESYAAHVRELSDIYEHYANPPRMLLRYVDGKYELVIELYKRPRSLEVLGFSSGDGSLLFRVRGDVGPSRTVAVELPISAEAPSGVCIAAVLDERAVFYYDPLDDPLVRDLASGHCVDANALRALASVDNGSGALALLNVGYKILGGSLPSGSADVIDGLISRGPILCFPDSPDIYGACNLYASLRPVSSVAAERFLSALTYDINSSSIWRFSGDYLVINLTDMYSKLRYTSMLVYAQALRLVRARGAATLRVDYFVNVTKPSAWAAYAVVAYVLPGDFNPSSLIALGIPGQAGHFSTPWLERRVLARGPLNPGAAASAEIHVSPASYGMSEVYIAVGVELVAYAAGPDSLSFIRVEIRGAPSP